MDSNINFYRETIRRLEADLVSFRETVKRYEESVEGYIRHLKGLILRNEKTD